MEDQFRKIVREEIARALSAAGEVAYEAGSNWPEDGSVTVPALGAISRTMERVARDVLANRHPEIPGHAVREDEHTTGTSCTECGRRSHKLDCSTGRASTPSTEPVHTITAVPERPKATCTCHRHVHVMGHDDRCGSAFCYCLTPLRARTADEVKTFGEHIGSTDVPRTCTVCSHGEHDQGECSMHVYRDSVAYPCTCIASRTLGAQSSTRRGPGCGHITCEGWRSCRDPKPSTAACTLCEHAPHGAGNCRYAVASGACLCTGARS